MPYELEHLGALYGRSDDIIRVYMVRDKVNSPSADPAVSQQPGERFDDVPCPLVIYDR
jgi:hypothetical protein